MFATGVLPMSSSSTYRRPHGRVLTNRRAGAGGATGGGGLGAGAATGGGELGAGDVTGGGEPGAGAGAGLDRTGMRRTGGPGLGGW